MADHSSNHTLTERLAADWPAAQWAGVHTLAAVSGGADSVALLLAMIEVRGCVIGAGRLFVGHVNHRQRGAESDADEAWLRKECHRQNVPLLVRQAEVTAGPPTSPSSEATLRSERYRLLAAMAEEVGARFVATAHTRDDQVETVLFRLLRGSGLRGLAGMPPTRALTPSVSLVRPLLGCSRADVLDYLQSRNQTWREDATNAELHYARNRLRHDVLPALRELFDVDAALLGAAAQARDLGDLLEPRIEQLCTTCDVCVTSRGVSLNGAALRAEPSILAAEVLRTVWRRAGWSEQAMNRTWWMKLAELARADRGGPQLNLPGNVLARRAGEQLILERPSERP